MALEVVAIAGGVLRDQRDLGHAPRGQCLAFRDDVLKRPGLISSADQRNRAIGAAVVAAVGDLHIGGVARRGQHAAGGEEAVVAIGEHGAQVFFRLRHHLGDAVVVLHAQKAVHLRHLRGQIAGIALGQAAGDEQLLQPARLLVLRHLEYGVDGFHLGGLDEAAGVDEDDVGLGGVSHDRVALLRQEAQQVLRIHAVLGTAQRDHSHGRFHMGKTLL